MLFASDDYMIKHVDVHQLSRADEIARDADVRIGWMGITARMIVSQDDGRCAGDNCQTKDFAWMNENGVHCSDGYETMPFDATTGV